ncbi:MAG: arginine--tRNA ligase [Methylacidiphilales bacterium]|nr:arginine--tRNA ligase [Candidatus Methylacidiphilales bacterium]
MENNLKIGAGPWAKPCQDERFGHFQTHLALVAGKSLQANPREIATRLASCFEGRKEFQKVEIAGPGFVNFTFTPEAIANALSIMACDPKLSIPATGKPLAILLDFSSPNVAKEMHVGHIRSTVLGESLARILSALGHHVIRDNHLGDWGTQFGMVLLGYKRGGSEEALRSDPFGHLEALYKNVQEESKTNPETLNQARNELLKLQQGDPENRALWQKFIDLSKDAIARIYERLDVRFDHTLGESFYNDQLPLVVDELLKKGIARKSEGAVAVFSDHTLPENNDPFLVNGKEGLKDNPFLIQKSDGAFLYGTTDLATIWYRVKQLKVDKAVYVTDARQQLHFRQLFATVQRWGLKVELEHVWFGTILGPDKTPIKTREGKPVKLKALLDEAEERAQAVISAKRGDLPAERQREIARTVGLGALKYADLSQNRNLDYVFDWDRLLSFDGNTAPYLLNAYVRTRSILRRAGSAGGSSGFELADAVEQELARKLLAFGDVVQLAAAEYRPHHICNYLYECAALFHRFFENCPVLKAESESLKNSRLQLCRLAGDVLQRGLHLLGIQTLEEM